MGVFKHEAAAVDPHERRVYMTEDLIDGRFYRFTPGAGATSREGLLEVASVDSGGQVDLDRGPDPSAARERTAHQVRGATRFKRGEGIWRDGHTVYVSTTADDRVHAYDIERRHSASSTTAWPRSSAPLLRVDQLTGSRAGEVFVCEDIATEEIDIGVIERTGACRGSSR